MSRNNAGSQTAKSMELWDPVAGWIYVISFLFSRHRLLCNKNVAISRPIAFVSTQPHKLLRALKSPNSRIGGGNWDTNDRRSVYFNKLDGGKFVCLFGV